MQFKLLLLVIYLAVINLTAFVLFGWDKVAAVQGYWRVRESTLLGISALGGSLGAFAAQQLFRHKISKRPFQARFAVILVLQAVVLVGLAVWIQGR